MADSIDNFLDSSASGNDHIDQFLDAPANIPEPTSSISIPGIAASVLSASTITNPQILPNVARGAALLPATADAGRFGEMANSFGRNLPPAIGGMIGATATAPIPGASIAGAAAGGAGARGLQQLANDALTQSTPAGSQVAKDMAVSGAGQAAAQGIAQGVSAIAPKIFDYLATSKIGGNIAQPAWDFFKNNVENVMSKIGSTSEDADQMANDLRSAISNSAQALEDKYREGLEAIRGNSTASNVDMSPIADAINQTIDKDFGYFSPGRTGNSADAQFFKNNISARLASMTSANPNELIDFQKDLNNYAADNYGSSLGAALQKAKSIVRSFINAKIPELADMNNTWATAQDIQAQSAKLTGANDLIGYVKRAFNNPQDTLQKRAIESVAGQVPEVGQGINDIRSYLAAQQVSPLIRSMTGTGGETGLAAAAIAGHYAPQIAANPILLGAAPAIAAISPRAYATVYQMAPTFKGALPAVSMAARAGAQSLAEQAMSYMSPESLSAYYAK